MHLRTFNKGVIQLCETKMGLSKPEALIGELLLSASPISCSSKASLGFTQMDHTNQKFYWR